MKNKKKWCIIISSIVLLSLIILLIFIFRNDIKSDNSKSFSISAQGKMTYFNDVFYIADPNSKDFGAFPDSEDKEYDCTCIAKVDDNIIYCNNNGLFMETPDGEATKLVDNYIYKFVVNKDNIYCITESSDLIIYNLKSKEITKKTFDYGSIEWIDISDDKIYIKSVVYQHDVISDGIRRKSGKQNITLFSIDINTYEQVSIFNINTEKGSEEVTPLLVGDKLLYNYSNNSTETNSIYLIDFTENSSEFLVRHDYITNIVANDKYVFFSSEKIDYTLYKKSDKRYRYTNAVWKYDLDTDKKTRISDNCTCEDLLVTDNYLYCYNISYVFPRTVFDNINFGYTIEQIEVN